MSENKRPDFIFAGVWENLFWRITTDKTLILKPAEGNECVVPECRINEDDVSSAEDSEEQMEIAVSWIPWIPYRNLIERVIADPGVSLGKYANCLFYKCENLVEVDLSCLKTDNTVSFKKMFFECDNLVSIKGLSAWNTQKAEDMSFMFCGCLSLDSVEELKNWNMKNIKTVECMFYACPRLSSIKSLEKWNIEGRANTEDFFSLMLDPVLPFPKAIQESDFDCTESEA